MATSPAPPASAARQASSLATMPALACPPPISVSIPRSSTTGIVRPSASRTPAVPPAMIRRRAPSRAATKPARVSALTLKICPPAPAPRLAMTGTWPAASRSISNAGGPDPTGLPTNPRSTSVPSRRPVPPFPPYPRDAAVGAGQAHRAGAGRAERRHESCVDAPGQHPRHHVQGGAVGDAQTVDGAFRNAEAGHLGVHLEPAAVHHHQRLALRRVGQCAGDPAQARPPPSAARPRA